MRAPPCSHCNGTGEIAKELGFGVFEADDYGVAMRPCPKCRGTGSSCVTPTGRTDGHNAYIENVGGVMRCAFCKEPMP